MRGVVEHQARIDEVLSTYAQGWTLDRMPAVDRNVLRIGVYEMLYLDDVPDAVAVTEAMALVRDLSTDESPSFVNGVLGAILKSKHGRAWLCLAPRCRAAVDERVHAAAGAHRPASRKPGRAAPVARSSLPPPHRTGFRMAGCSRADRPSVGP